MSHRLPIPLMVATLAGGVLLAVILLVTGPGAPSGALQSLTDLAIQKYTDPGAYAVPGGEVKFVIFFQNVSLVSTNDVIVRDYLPAGTTYVSSTQPGLTLIQAGPDQWICYKDRLSDFEMGWLSLTIRVDNDVPPGTVLRNTVQISTIDPESNYANNEYSLDITVLSAEPDLEITKKLLAGVPGPGNELAYQIHYWNRGGSDAHDVYITDTLPLSCTYVSDAASGGFSAVITGTQTVWMTDTVPANSEGYLHINAQIDAGWNPAEDWLIDVAEASISDVEYNYGNNRATHTIKPAGERRYGAAVTSVGDQTLQLVRDAGFDYVLYYLDWATAEPLDNEYDWRELDSAVWQAWRYNLDLIVRVDGAPAWARGAGDDTAPPSNPAKLGEFLAAVAERFPYSSGASGAAIRGFIVWNEPNLAAEWGGNTPDAAAYTALLQAAYNGVKGAAADAWVISAGLATTNENSATAVDDRIFLQAMYTAGAASYFDYLGVNPMGFASAPDDYSDPNGLDFSRAEELRQIMVNNGDSATDMFATEMGWLRDTATDLSGYNWMKVSDVDQAHYLARAYGKAYREWPWMGPVMLWNMDFAGFYEEAEHERWFGVTDAGLNPLRAYLTLQNLATHGTADYWVETELIGAATPGQDVDYTIHVTNVGGQPAAGARVTDTLPPGFTYVSDTRGDSTPTAGQISWDISSLEAGARETITLTLHYPDPAPVTTVLSNCVQAGPVAGEPYVDDNGSCVGIAQAMLTVSKSDELDPIPAGWTHHYTIDVSNSLTETIHNVLVTDTLPANVAYQSSSPSGVWDSNRTVTWNIGDLASDASQSIDVYVKPSLTITDGTVITNTVQAAGDDSLLNGATETTTIVRPSLAISKSDELDPIAAGWLHTYTIGITNTSAFTIHNVLVTDTLPADVAYQSSSPTGVWDSNRTVTWNLGDLAPNAVRAIDVSVNANASISEGTIITNTVEAGGVDSVLSSASEETTVVSSTLLLTKSDERDPIPAGWNHHYTIHVSNPGTKVIHDVMVTDTLPAQTMYQTSQPAGAWDNGQTVTWSLGDMNPGDSQTIEVYVHPLSSIPAGTTITNRAQASGSDASTISETTEDTLISAAPPTSTPTVTPTATATLDAMATETPTPTGLWTTTPTRTATATPAATAIGLRQGANGYDGNSDTHIDLMQRGMNFGSQPRMYLKTDDNAAILTSFDLSQVAGEQVAGSQLTAANLPAEAVVMSATLRLHIENASPADAPVTLRAYRLLRPWAEDEATWNLATAGAAWTAAGANGAGMDRLSSPEDEQVCYEPATNAGWIALDVTAAVQHWLAHPAENYGLAIKAYTCAETTLYTISASESSVAEHRAELWIDYYVPDPTPTVTSTPTATATATPTDTVLPGTHTPTATATVTGTPTHGAVVGHVWLDVTKDGVWNAGEPPLAGALVALYQSGAQVDSHTTGADGYFGFGDLLPGEYTLIETDPAGYASTTDNYRVAAVQAGENVVIDFGDYLMDTPTPTGTPTATSTATPTLPARAWLPLLLK